MSDSGYRGFIRGIKGSTKEHLTDLEFKIKKETEKLEKITNSVDEKQSSFNNYMQYVKQIDDISNLGKQKTFSKRIELEPKDYETLTKYAKKGIVADKEKQDELERQRIELSNEEYEYVEKLKQEYYKKLENMTKEERLQYFRDNIAIENKLNFEKEINGTIYKVNTYFDENAKESILNKFFRLTKKS